MNLRCSVLGGVLLCMGAAAVSAQTPAAIPLNKEPHHHRMLHNDLVNVYRVEVQPHDSVLLHHHYFDAISIMSGDAQVVVRAPGKPEVRQNLTEGQVRLQPAGYEHSTYIDGTNTYHNVTVELLRPQQDPHNLCVAVIGNQPLHCTQPEAGAAGEQPLFATDETTISMARVLPNQEIKLSGANRSKLMVALDGGALESAGGKVKRELHPGDFVWLAKGAPAGIFKNNGGKESRLVIFALKP